MSNNTEVGTMVIIAEEKEDKKINLAPWPLFIITSILTLGYSIFFLAFIDIFNETNLEGSARIALLMGFVAVIFSLINVIRLKRWAVFASIIMNAVAIYLVSLKTDVELLHILLPTLFTIACFYYHDRMK